MRKKLIQKPMADAPIINVGVAPESIDAFAAMIEKIFKSAFETRMDQGTVRSAVYHASKTLSVSNVTISSNNFDARKIIGGD